MKLNKKRLAERRATRKREDEYVRSQSIKLNPGAINCWFFRMNFRWTSWIEGNRGYLVPTGCKDILLTSCYERTKTQRAAMRTDTSEGNDGK